MRPIRTPGSRRRALALSAILVAATLAIAALSGPAAASQHATIDVEDASAGADTNHNWSIAVGGSVDANLSSVFLDYGGTGTDVSNVTALDVSVNGSVADVDSVTADGANETVDILLNATVSLSGGETVTVNGTSAEFANPATNGTYPAGIWLYDDLNAEIANGSASFTIGDGGGTDTGYVNGTVTDDGTGAAIDGATVSILDGEVVKTNATTDASGNYSIEVETGTYDVLVEADGYDVETVSDVGVSTDLTTTVDVSLTAQGGGGDGGTLDVTVLDKSVKHVGGTQPHTMPTVSNYTTNLLGVQLRDATNGTEELSALGVDSTTEFEIELVVENLSPRVLVGTARDASWSWTPHDQRANTTNVTITAKPGEAQYVNGNYDLQNWPEGGNDAADVAYQQMVDLALGEMTYVSETERNLIDGLVVTTDAQIFSDPMYEEVDGNAALTMTVAGPHYTTTGTTNEGYYEGFLPSALLDAWGVSDPDDLAANYDGAESDITVTEVQGGYEFAVVTHYSVADVEVTSASGGGSSGGSPSASYGGQSDDGDGEDGADGDAEDESSGDGGDEASGDEEDGTVAGDGADGDDDDGDVGGGVDDVGDSVPGFGLLAGAIALVTAAVLRGRT